MGSCRRWQQSLWPGEGRGSLEGSRGLRGELAMESREGGELKESYIPFRGKCYKNRVSGNPSAPRSASGGGQVTSSRSASPGWGGLPRILSGNLAEKATEEHRARPLNSLAEASCQRGLQTSLDFHRKLKCERSRDLPKATVTQWRFPSPRGFQAVAAPRSQAFLLQT